MALNCSRDRSRSRTAHFHWLFFVFFLTSDFLLSVEAKAMCHPKFKLNKGHTACLEKSMYAESVETTETLKNEFLNAHNERRAQVEPPSVDMLKMYWDDELEMLAKKWADNCVYEHDKLRFIPGRFSVGQNLAKRYVTGPTKPVFDDAFFNATAAIEAWFNERFDYVYGEELAHVHHDPPIGHYTQMAWAQSFLLGCAITNCMVKTNPFRYVVCNYGPGGNITPFSSPYKMGTSCRDCKTCVNGGLCECGTGKSCSLGARLHPGNCTCGCQGEYSSGAQCELECLPEGRDGPHCNTQNAFMESNCHKAYMVTHYNGCPYLCKACPVAGQNYKWDPKSEKEKKNKGSNLGGSWSGVVLTAVAGSSTVSMLHAYNLLH